MRLIIDVDKQYKKLFLEVAKAAKAKVRIDEQYVVESESEHDETQFLLRNPKNRERLMKSIKNAEEGKVVEVDIDSYLSKLDQRSK